MTSASGASHATNAAARFVVGMSRSGTTWMAKCLGEHSHLVSFGESAFWGRGYVAPRTGNEYDKDELAAVAQSLKRQSWTGSFGNGPGHLKKLDRSAFDVLVDRAIEVAEQDGDPRPGQVFTRLAELVARTEGKSGWVEKTPHHINWVKRIVNELPDARFVIMMRDPYGFLLSYKHMGDHRPAKQRRAFRRLFHPLPMSYLWTRYALACSSAARDLADRAMIVQFADLKRDPEMVLERVQRFLGVPVEPLAERVPPDNTSFPTGQRPELGPADVFFINRMAGRTMSRLGYERMKAKPVPFQVVLSLLRLPTWFVQNFCAMRGLTHGSTFAYLSSWWRSPSETSRDASHSETRA